MLRYKYWNYFSLNKYQLKFTVSILYYLINEADTAFTHKPPSQPTASINQAMPKCTIKPPQMLPVLNAMIPNNKPPQKLLIASAIGLPKCMVQ